MSPKIPAGRLTGYSFYRLEVHELEKKPFSRETQEEKSPSSDIFTAW